MSLLVRIEICMGLFFNVASSMQRCSDAWLFIVRSVYTNEKKKYTGLAHFFRRSAPSDPSLLVQFSERKRNGNKGDKCEACRSSFAWYSLPCSIDNPCTCRRRGREITNLACCAGGEGGK